MNAPPPSRMKYWAIAIFVALAATSCSAVVESGAGEEPGFGTCDDSQELVDLLQSGLPVYDYNPTPDLNTLIERSDVIVTGSIYMAVREEGPGPEGDPWTRITGDSPVLHARTDELRERFLAEE